MSAEDIQAIREELAKIKAQQAKSDESKREEFKNKYNEFKKKYPLVFKPDDDSDIDCPKGQHYDQKLGKCVPDTPDGCPELRDDGRPQPHKGGSTDPKKWKVVQMTDDPTLWKVVDDKNINVADQFHSDANARRYIDHYLCTPLPPPPPPPGPPPAGQVGPYPTTGQQIMMDVDDEAGTRHYASGAPDDRTINAKAGGIAYENYQVIVDVTMKEIEHDDQVSIKLGGTHMGTGWFDNTVSFEQGETCLGKEEDHPSTDLCVETGPSIGNILNKPLKMACIYRRKTNFVELWTNFEGSGWKKQLEGADIGGFNPGSDEDEALLRIDGFSEGGSKPGEGNVPTIRLAVVQEIKEGGGSTPPSPPGPGPTPPPPPPPPGPTPTGEVKKIYEPIGAPILGKFSSSNADRFQWKFDLPKCYLAQEATCYLKIAQVNNDGEEVSLKLRGGNHSSSDSSTGSCYIIGIGYDGSVNSQYEQPHPNNHSMSSTVVTPSPLGNSIVGKSFGIKAIVYPQGNADKIECWIDTGGLVAAGKPANQWVKFWETTSTQFFGRCNGKGEEKALIRLDDIPGGDNQENVEIAFATVQEIRPPTSTQVSKEEKEAVEAAKTVMKEAESPTDKKDAAKTLKKAELKKTR